MTKLTDREIEVELTGLRLTRLASVLSRESLNLAAEECACGAEATFLLARLALEVATATRVRPYDQAAWKELLARLRAAAGPGPECPEPKE